MSKLYFKIGADYDKVIRLRDEIAKLKQELLSMNQAINPQAFARLEVQLRQTTQEFDRLVRQAAIAGAQLQTTTININHLNNGFGNLNSMLAKVGGTAVLTKLASDIVRVRGEFQQLEVAFNTMLGSKEKSNTLMQQLVKTAATTPFDLQSVSQGAKQLLAYGSSVDNVNNEIITLGNVAAGVSIPLGDLVYLYGTLRSQGRAYSVDIKQFAGRGIPIYAELAKVMKVNVDEVNALIKAGKVGFPQVEQAFKNMTSGGGMFYNLMQEQSKTITGQISNIGDSISMMYNNIGKSSEGMINNALSGVSYLVANYEQVGKTVLELAATYGAYRAVLISVAAYQSFAVGITYSTEIAELSKLISLKQQSANQDVIAAVASGKLTQSKAEQVIALRAEIAAKMQSMQATKTKAQAEFSSALATYKASRLRYTVAQEQVVLAQSQMSIAIKSGAVEEIAAAKKNAQTVSQELNNAAIAKNTAHKGVNIAATNSKSASEALNTLETGRNSVAQTVNTASTNILTAAKTRLAAASKALGLSMLADPYVWVAAAIVGLGYVVYKAATSVTEAEKAQSRLDKATKDVASSVTEEQNKLSKMNDILQQSKKGSDEWKKAKDAIVKQFGEYFSGLDAEIERTGDLTTSYGKLSVAIKKSIAARNFKEFAENENKESSSSMTELLQAAYKNLQENYDSKTANQLISKIREYVFNGVGIDKESLKKISYGNWAYINMENAKQAKIASDKNLQNYKDIYGISEEDANEILYGIPGEKKDDKKTEVLNKEHWETQKKDAETAIDAIDSKQRKLLNAGKFDKVDSTVVTNYKEQKRLIAEAEKELKAYPSTSDTNKQESAADKLRKQQESIREQQDKNAQLDKKQSLDRQRQQQDLENQAAQAEIDALGDSFEKIEKQRILNNKKEIQSLERQKEDFINAVIQFEKEKFDAKENLIAKQNPKHVKETFDPSTVKVDTSVFDSIIGNTSKKQLNDKVREQEDSWNEYLIKYGLFTQKKEAIDRKYKKLIEEAPDAGQAATLQKEWEESVANLNLDKLKQDINWEVVFGDMSKVAKKQLQEVKKQITEFKKSPEFKKSSPETIKVIEEALDKINSALVDKGGFFGGLSDSLNDYKTKLEEAKKAQEEYDAALKTGNQALIEKATKNRNTANANVTNAGTNVEKSKDKAVSNINAVSNAIVQLGKKDVSLTDIGNTIGALVDTLGKSGSMIGGIISAILSIIDAAGEIGTFQYGMNLVENVSTKVTDAFAKDTEAITGLDMSFMKSADYDDYNELVEQYDVLMDVWDQLLDKKKAYIKESYGAEAAKVGQEALDLLNSEKKITKELASSRLDAGASAGSHSINYRMWKGSYDYNGTNWKDVAGDISKSLGGVDFSSMWSMLDMSAEQLEWIKTNYSELWSKMDGDFRGYLDDIIKYGDTEKEIIKSTNEQLTQTSFDSLFDSFVNTLMDMDSSSQDFADNFEEYMRKAIFTSMFAKNYETELENWYKDFAQANKKEGGITADDVTSLKTKWDGIVNGALSDREAWEQIVGSSNSSSSQSSTQKSFEAMSQDSADELNGRFTALQIAGEEIKNQNIIQSQSLNLLTMKADSIFVVNTEVKNIADEIRTIQINSYLELQEIRENTGAIVKPIQQMQKDIEAIKDNTKNM